MPDKTPVTDEEMVEGTDNDGNKVLVAKTRPEETVPSVRSQRGVLFSRAEQDRLANAHLAATGDAPVGESVGASPQASSTTSLPSTTSGAPARGGATRTSTTRPKGQE